MNIFDLCFKLHGRGEVLSRVIVTVRFHDTENGDKDCEEIAILQNAVLIIRFVIVL